MRVWAAGRLVAPGDPVYPASDPVPAHGLGVFETCAVVGGEVVDLDQHLARLERSAAALGLAVGDVRTGIAAVLGPESGMLRITVGSPTGPVVVAGPLEPRPAPTVRRSPWVRNERSPLAGHKSTARAADALALAEVQRQGADEALLADTRGRLSEGTTSNVWVEVDGALLTPALSSGCLPGIVRGIVLERAAAAGLPVREAELPWSVLDRVVAGDAGLAISSSLRWFAPVVALDGSPVRATPLVAAVRDLVGRGEVRR